MKRQCQGVLIENDMVPKPNWRDAVVCCWCGTVWDRMAAIDVGERCMANFEAPTPTLMDSVRVTDAYAGGASRSSAIEGSVRNQIPNKTSRSGGARA